MSLINLLINDPHPYFNLKDCIGMESPQPGHLVLAVESLERKGRQYIVVKPANDQSAYEWVQEYLTDPKYASSPYALHEVVRAGVPRRVMFDVDYSTAVPLKTLQSHVRLLQKAYAVAFEGYGNPWEIDLGPQSFALTVSDDGEPFKGFHLLHERVVMPARSVDRLYSAIEEILMAGTYDSYSGEGKELMACLDPKPRTAEFNMRLYGSCKVTRAKNASGRPRLTRQKRVLDISGTVVFDEYAELRDYVIQPAPGGDAPFIYETELHPDDLLDRVGRSGAGTVTYDLSEQLSERLAKCELLQGWQPRGEVKSGEVSGAQGKSWWRLDLTLVNGSQRHLCSVCDRFHSNRTDYLWLTGKGLVDATKPIYVRCRSRAQSAEEKERGHHQYNVVATIPGVGDLSCQSSTLAQPVLAPTLKYAFSFEGYKGKALKTPLTAFLDSQKSAHLVAIEAADRSAATKRAEKAQLNADLATAVAHQQNVMQQALEAEKEDCSAVYAALDELKRRGADYAIYGQRDFDDLTNRVYKDEYEMLCAIHCNAWVHDQEGAAIWDEGRWETRVWDSQTTKDKREQMVFRTESGAKYSGRMFWRVITSAYARNSQTCFTPHPLGRSAIGLPSPSVWRMSRGINNYNGLRACPLPKTNVSALSQHRDVFEHFLRSQIAGEGDEYYRYLMGWIASAMQRPHEKIGVALLIRGPMGCGKSLFVSLLKAIVPHATVVTNKGLTTLTDKFNTDLDNRTLYMFGEVPEARRVSHDQLAAIKTIITDDVLHIEYKNKTIVQKKQYLNLIVCSNMLNCIETSEGDRRWCVMNTPFPVHDKDDLEYWERTYPLFSSPEFQASIQQLLLDYDIPASGFVPKEYPKSEALQVTRNEVPVVNYALKYPNLRQRVTTYLQDKPDYELNRPATIRDIVICHRVDEGSESSRSDSVEQQEKDLYYAMCNVPQLKERFSFHPDNDGGRLERINAAGRKEVLKHAIVWGAETDERTYSSVDSAAVRDRDAAMGKMVMMMKAAGLDVSEFVRQFPALGDDPDRYDSMSKVQLQALVRERKITLVRNPSVALMRSKLREFDLKA